MLGCSFTDMAMRFVEYMCLCMFASYSLLDIVSFCFRFGDVLCDVLCLFVAIFGCSVNVFRSNDAQGYD